MRIMLPHMDSECCYIMTISYKSSQHQMLLIMNKNMGEIAEWIVNHYGVGTVCVLWFECVSQDVAEDMMVEIGPEDGVYNMRIVE